MTDLPRFVDVTPSEFRELLDSLDNPDRCLVCRRAFADDEMSALVLIQDEQLGLVGRCCEGRVSVFFRLRVRLRAEDALAFAPPAGRA
jgi:hypothetical protein